MSHLVPAEIADTPLDREALCAIGSTYDPELDIDYDIADAAYLDALWLGVIAPWLSRIPDEAFAEFERKVERRFVTRDSNIAGFAKQRAADLLMLVTDWRWQTWANDEVSQGRDPYQPAA